MAFSMILNPVTGLMRFKHTKCKCIMQKKLSIQGNCACRLVYTYLRNLCKIMDFDFHHVVFSLTSTRRVDRGLSSITMISIVTFSVYYT